MTTTKMWHRVETANDRPSPRAGASLTHTGSSDKCILFGGASVEEGTTNHCWLLDPESLQWTTLELSSASLNPPPRYDHLALYLPPTSATAPPRLLVFGGSDVTAGLLNDLWTLDLSTNTWSLHASTASTPSPRTARYAGTLVAQQVFLYGGGVEGNRAVDDDSVYALDIDTMQWSRTSRPAGKDTTWPTPRLGHVVFSAPDGSSIYSHGGMDADKLYSELWRYDVHAQHWQQVVSRTAAPTLSGHAVAQLPASSGGDTTAIVHGGLRSPTALSDATYIFHQASETFERLNNSAGDLQQRLDHSMCIVSHQQPQSSVMVLAFGGADLSGLYQDLHTLRL
ncbi:hypothetical protein RI367_001697 [Sorochytrium milnesiophthora]